MPKLLEVLLMLLVAFAADVAWAARFTLEFDLDGMARKVLVYALGKATYGPDQRSLL